MSLTFKVELAEETPERMDLSVGFVGEAGNERRVTDAVAAIKQLDLKGGPLVRFNGPCSLPVAMALAHAVAHLYGAVAVFDPKLQRYVVSISHRPDLTVGTLLE